MAVTRNTESATFSKSQIETEKLEAREMLHTKTSILNESAYPKQQLHDLDLHVELRSRLQTLLDEGFALV